MTAMIELAVGSATLAAWLYLVGGRGGFWRADTRDDRHSPPAPACWPDVIAIIPARDEAELVGETVTSLLRQDYPGPLTVILVDDQSRDGTAAVARQAAASADAAGRLTVLGGRTPPAGWAGKVWAMKQGVDHVKGAGDKPRYLLFTDADIAYEPASLRQLVARAEAGGLALTSLMVKLRCRSLSERCFVPAFVFLFQMLYPFPWVNRPDRRTAAAAGGCMLVRSDALSTAGGIDAIRGSLIDDCALGARLKAVGPIWLGLTQRVHSRRAYARLRDIRRMVVRSAYDQLGYSPLMLAATIAGLALIYLAPPLLALAGSGLAQILAGVAYALMVVAFQPMLRFYRVSPLWGLALPGIALAYMAFTLDSAYQHARGRGGLWKGRVHANVSELR